MKNVVSDYAEKLAQNEGILRRYEDSEHKGVLRLVDAVAQSCAGKTLLVSAITSLSLFIINPLFFTFTMNAIDSPVECFYPLVVSAAAVILFCVGLFITYRTAKKKGLKMSTVGLSLVMASAVVHAACAPVLAVITGDAFYLIDLLPGLLIFLTANALRRMLLSGEKAHLYYSDIFLCIAALIMSIIFLAGGFFTDEVGAAVFMAAVGAFGIVASTALMAFVLKCISNVNNAAQKGVTVVRKSGSNGVMGMDF